MSVLFIGVLAEFPFASSRKSPAFPNQPLLPCFTADETARKFSEGWERLLIEPNGMGFPIRSHSSGGATREPEHLI